MPCHADNRQHNAPPSHAYCGRHAAAGAQRRELSGGRVGTIQPTQWPSQFPTHIAFCAQSEWRQHERRRLMLRVLLRPLCNFLSLVPCLEAGGVPHHGAHALHKHVLLFVAPAGV